MPTTKVKLPTVMARVSVERKLGAKTKTGYETDVIFDVIEVEVLTVHFTKLTMRVRYTEKWYGKDKIQTVNVPAAPYFEKYGWPGV